MDEEDELSKPEFVKNGRSIPVSRKPLTSEEGVLTLAAREHVLPFQYFEQQLVMYVTSDDKSTFTAPFDISKIPVVTREQADAEDRTKKLTATTPSLKPPKVGPTKSAATGAEAAARLLRSRRSTPRSSCRSRR